MDLFASGGVETGGGGHSGRAVPRTLRVPLFNYKVIRDALKKVHLSATEEQLVAAARYATKARSPKFSKEKETAVRNLFFEDVLCTILGYRKLDPEQTYTLAFERPIRGGSVDVALGQFRPDGNSEIVAPFEMKGPGTRDLDAIMPGRKLSPVQQAWGYAIDAPGSRWVLVSNCVEIRLYGFGRGRDAYESFDLTKLDDPDELERLWLLLSADRLLGGATDALLRETDSAYKDITDKLYVEYRELRERLVSFLIDSADGPKLSPPTAIETAQKLLDRILFVAFAERTDLLPDKLLERAANAKNEFLPEPVWRNFHALFRNINVGNQSLAIWAYNGGLFAPDPVADGLIIPDPLAGGLAKLAEWDYRSEVPVTVLGHIFEQSITDLERLRAQRLGQAEPKVTKRKREGVVYTPDIVTRFLVERTIGVTLEERFSQLLAKHGKAGAYRGNGDTIFSESERETERLFWRDYLAALRSLTIVDPACGSGAFLVAAFDLLASEYRRVVNHLADLGETVDFDPFDEIVTRNLYGVDLNAESVEITRLALWLKTARRQHRLQSLEDTIKVGNSLIADAKYTDRPFDWRAAFPAVFAKGGFDIVIGNPPYVRSETFSKLKPALKEEYGSFDGGADLYCYFYEKGLSILKENGRLGFISSSGFFKTAFGTPLRAFLSKYARFESGVDFGDAKVFEDVTTYPAVVTLRKEQAKQAYSFLFLNFDGSVKDDLSAIFSDKAFPYPSDRLSRSRWHFEPKDLWKLRDHLEMKSENSLENVGTPVSGIKTGLTKAFVISEEIKNEIVSKDAKSIDLIRSWMIGDDLARWTPEQDTHYLIFIPKGWTKSIYGEGTESVLWKKVQKQYPSIASWLQQFENEGKKRSDKGDFWWELRACDYYELFDQELVTFPEMSQGAKFAIKGTGSVSNNKTFLIPNSDRALLAFLNSRAAWFLLRGICTALRGGKWRLELRADFLKDLPLPKNKHKASNELKGLAKKCIDLTSAAYEIESTVRNRIFDLSAKEREKALSRKLEKWWELSFDEFRVEIKRAFKVDIPVKERDQWQKYLAKNAEKVRVLNAQIEQAEREIDAIVYRLFDLSPDEIRLLEESTEGQH